MREPSLKEMEGPVYEVSLKHVKKLLKEKRVGSVHLIGCRCVVCRYDYPNKEYVLELVHFQDSMPTGPVIPRGD